MYPATLLNSIINSYSFLLESFKFSTYSIMSSANSDNYTSSFLICIFFFLFHVYSSTRLHKSGESGHPCLASDRRETAFGFSLLSIMLAGGFPPMTCIIFQNPLFIPTSLRVFLIISGC